MSKKQNDSESSVVTKIREMFYLVFKGRIFRNNVGVAFNAEGRPIRYGLCNSSKQQNTLLKSSDFVGWVSVEILPHHVGKTFALFLGIEAKEEGWKYSDNNIRYKAQKAYLDLINNAGGIGTFATCFEDVRDAINKKVL